VTFSSLVTLLPCHQNLATPVRGQFWAEIGFIPGVGTSGWPWSGLRQVVQPQVNGQKLLRAMHLGPVVEITKERLYEASFAMKRKLAAISA